MRRIIRVGGADRVDFLQGLVTNDVTRAPVWAALLTAQGKYLADFLIVPQDDALLLDVDARLADDLLRRLSMYKLRAAVELASTDLKVTRGTGTAPDGAIPTRATRHSAGDFTAQRKATTAPTGTPFAWPMPSPSHWSS